MIENTTTLLECPLCKADLVELNENYNHCLRCSLAVSKKPSGEYDETYYYGAEGWNSDLIVRSLKLFDIASKFIKKDNEILDFGCNVGIFVDRCNRENYKADGLDISERSLRISKHSAKGNFYTPGEINKKYDVITAFDVIEHFEDLDFFMNEVDHYLNKTGYVIITTPNINSKWISYFGFGWHGFGIPQYHRYILSKKALDLLATKHNYKVVFAECYGILGNHGWKYAVNSAYRLKKNKFQKLRKIPSGILKYIILKIRQQYKTDTLCCVLQK